MHGFPDAEQRLARECTIGGGSFWSRAAINLGAGGELFRRNQPGRGKGQGRPEVRGGRPPRTSERQRCVRKAQCPLSPVGMKSDTLRWLTKKRVTGAIRAWWHTLPEGWASLPRAKSERRAPNPVAVAMPSSALPRSEGARRAASQAGCKRRCAEATPRAGRCHDGPSGRGLPATRCPAVQNSCSRCASAL